MRKESSGAVGLEPRSEAIVVQLLIIAAVFVRGACIGERCDVATSEANRAVPGGVIDGESASTTVSVESGLEERLQLALPDPFPGQ